MGLLIQSVRLAGAWYQKNLFLALWAPVHGLKISWGLRAPFPRSNTDTIANWLTSQVSPHVKEVKTGPHHWFQILDSSLCQWNLYNICRFQSLVRAILDSLNYTTDNYANMPVTVKNSLIQGYSHYNDHIPPAYDNKLLFCNTVSSRQK